MASAVNQSVVQFAQQQMGSQVGAGECWDLAEEALRNAGAKTSNDIMGAKKVTANADYKWGTPIKLMSLEEGDIIQFRNYKYTLTNDDGSWEEQERPHHTAVVAKVWYHGCVEVYEQNVANQRRVERHTLYFQSGSADGATVKLRGTTWFYRPLKK